MHYKWYVWLGLLLCSCQSSFNKKKGPDISKVKLNITVDHFEKQFFALDTNNLQPGLNALKKSYGIFYGDFLYSIAAFSPKTEDLDSGIIKFLQHYKSLADKIDGYFPDLDRDLKPIEKALKRAKVYFPKINVPDRLITYIGPLDSYGTFIDKGNIAIGLQQFLGPEYSGYQSEYMENLFGKQKLRCFSKAYIPTAAMCAWVRYTFPAKSGNIRLIDKMVEDGRILYAVHQLLPETPDSILLGYSKVQMDWCENHEDDMIDYFQKDKLFESKDPETIIKYTSDQLTAKDLPKECPSNIGKFMGLRLIRRYTKNHPKDSTSALFEHGLASFQGYF